MKNIFLIFQFIFIDQTFASINCKNIQVPKQVSKYFTESKIPVQSYEFDLHSQTLFNLVTAKEKNLFNLSSPAYDKIIDAKRKLEKKPALVYRIKSYRHGSSPDSLEGSVHLISLNSNKNENILDFTEPEFIMKTQGQNDYLISLSDRELGSFGTEYSLTESMIKTFIQKYCL